MLPEHPTLPELVYYSLRRDELLCNGPHSCDEAAEIRDEDGLLLRRERCESCPLEQLERSVAQDPVLHRAFDLDFALTAGIRLGLDEINCEEWRALKVLRIERDKYQAEQIKQQQKQR